jgi:CubicO group peptidase (beta-lactamase class C family)
VLVNPSHIRANQPLNVRWHITRAILAALAIAFTAGMVPVGKPEEVGLSSDRLHRVHQLMQRYIDDKVISGAVTVVARRGRVAHFETHGLMDVEHNTPMRRDAIFRMASMTKPVTGVAVMMLLEEGKIRLSDPISKFIPEFKETKVAVEKLAPAGVTASSGGNAQSRTAEILTVPANREITIRDLLTHTSGLESGGAGTREGARIAPRKAGDNLAAYIPQLGAVPLDFQPGTMWRYSALAGIDTLGRIVEVVSGLTFDQFLKQRIFDPLGMKDTAFVVPDEKQSRVAALYGRSPKGLQRQDTPAWLATKTLFSGGGGLWSTADDYIQFAQMLVGGGELNGKRLLSPRTVDLMAANHVGQLFADSTANGNRRGMGFGLTVEVVVDPIAAGRRTSEGSFGWDGAFGTHFWVDRKEQLTGLLLIQQASNAVLNRDFENAVMQAVVE